MTLREFILNESCNTKKCAAKDFEDEIEVEDGATDVEEKETEKDGEFSFTVKISTKADSEEEAKKAIKDALDGFDVKFKADKKKEEGEAAKKHKDVCPQCGKKFDECTCK